MIGDAPSMLIKHCNKQRSNNKNTPYFLQQRLLIQKVPWLISDARPLLRRAVANRKKRTELET